jgi:hypothetical protein
MTALQPGDLFYSVVPETGEVVTEVMWTVMANEGVVPPEKLAPEMPDKPYWSVLANCGYDYCREHNVECQGPPYGHYLLLGEGEYVLASELPSFTVARP